jgi:hypothetical protein
MRFSPLPSFSLPLRMVHLRSTPLVVLNSTTI